MLSESVDLKEVKKRISHDNEFDNGKVFFSYYDWTEDEAQEKAKEASLKDPKDIYYVKYDDIMNPAGDFIWFRGKQYNYKDRDKLRNVNESYLDNSDEYVIDRLKNDLLYNYKIKPADIVKKGNYFLVVFFTREDKEKVMNRPDMLSPVTVKGELGYPYRFGSIDINAMRKANNPKYDRIIREYDEYTLQKKYNDFSIHSIDDVAEDELEEAFVLSIDDIKDEFKKMIDKHPEWTKDKAIEFAGDILLDKGVSYKDLYKAKEEFEISLKEDYVLVRLSSGSRHNNKVEYSIEKVEAHKPDGGAITWGRHNEHKVDRMPSQIIASSDSKEELELKARELVEKIIKVDGKYRVQSEKGRNMGTYDTKKEAEDRLKEVEMFKHLKESSSSASDWVQEVSLSELDDIIEDRSPRGLFLSKDGDKYIAVDNSSYDAWTEEFDDREDAIAFLMKESLSEDVTYVGGDPDTGAKIYKSNGRYFTTYRGETMSADNLDELRDMLAVKWDNDTYNWSNLSEDADELEDEPDWLVKWGRDPLNRLIGDRDTGDRNIKPGINWTWFWTDNKQDAIRWFKQLTGVLPYESTLVKDGNNWGFRLDREFVDELEEPIDDSDEWISRTPEYWKDDYKLPEDFKEDLKDINPFLADLVAKSSSTLKRYLRDPKFSEEEKKQIRTELSNRGFYPRGKGPNSISFRNSRNESSSN